jgi:hypothetical protein
MQTHQQTVRCIEIHDHIKTKTVQPKPIREKTSSLTINTQLTLSSDEFGCALRVQSSVIQVSSFDSCAATADGVVAVAEGRHPAGRDVADGGTVQWVAEENDGGYGSRGVGGQEGDGAVHELRALAVA